MAVYTPPSSFPLSSSYGVAPYSGSGRLPLRYLPSPDQPYRGSAWPTPAFTPTFNFYPPPPPVAPLRPFVPQHPGATPTQQNLLTPTNLMWGGLTLGGLFVLGTAALYKTKIRNFFKSSHSQNKQSLETKQTQASEIKQPSEPQLPGRTPERASTDSLTSTPEPASQREGDNFSRRNQSKREKPTSSQSQTTSSAAASYSKKETTTQRAKVQKPYSQYIASPLATLKNKLSARFATQQPERSGLSGSPSSQQPVQWSRKQVLTLAAMGIPAALLISRFALSKAGYNVSIPLFDSLVSACQRSLSDIFGIFTKQFKNFTVSNEEFWNTKFADLQKDALKSDFPSIPKAEFLPKPNCEGMLGKFINHSLKANRYSGQYASTCQEMQSALENIAYPKPIINNLSPQVDAKAISKWFRQWSLSNHPDKFMSESGKQMRATLYQSVSGPIQDLVNVLKHHGERFTSYVAHDLAAFNSNRATRFKVTK